MTRYVVAAALAFALVAGAGYAIYVTWMREPASAHAATTPPVAPSIAAPVAAPAPEPTVRVVRIEGTVEKRVGASWIPVNAGESLTEQDTIRTGAKARAEIDVGATVLVEARTEITVGEISAHVSQVVLSAGHVSANAQAGTTIRIATPETETFAEATAGAFDVLSSGTGQVTVATKRGNAKVTARGETVAVGEGTQTIVRHGEAPTEPTAIPSSLFLKISAAGTDREISAIRGETTPGAVLTINGERTTPDAAGTFAQRVAFPKGSNVIVIMVEDAMGRQETRVVRRTAVHPPVETPKLETTVDWK
ncbi:MAG: hypothetical protein HOV81_42415 [Kofleriaceae bacterium]|nr:hypothetical protein [Kofleriaceae bacterium]